jgi:hypothetical protein
MKAALVVIGMLWYLGAHAVTPTPVCQNERQCGAMWAAAQVAIATATGMAIRSVTDTLIETHPATHHPRLTGVVRKIPAGQDGYKIVVDLSCYPSTQCDDIARAGTELFNTLVINAGADLGPLPEAGAIDRAA